MEVSVQIPPPPSVAVNTVEECLVPTAQEAGWHPDQVWLLTVERKFSSDPG